MPFIMSQTLWFGNELLRVQPSRFSAGRRLIPLCVLYTLPPRLIDPGLELRAPLVSHIIPNVSCVNDRPGPHRRKLPW